MRFCALLSLAAGMISCALQNFEKIACTIQRRDLMLGAWHGRLPWRGPGPSPPAALKTPNGGADQRLLSRFPGGRSHDPCLSRHAWLWAGLPVVLVVQEIFGVQCPHSRMILRALAQQVYLAICPRPVRAARRLCRAFA